MRTFRRAAILVLLLCVGSTAQQTTRASAPVANANASVREATHDLPNFARVDEHLYRGAQPTEDGLRKLKAMGIKTVINLRDDDERAARERDLVQALGMRYFNVPMKGLSRPTDEQIARVIALIDAPENWPVFIHCKRGADRTGTVIACYRIARQGWKAKEAIAEAKRFGMSFFVFAMRDYIRDYERRCGQANCVAATSKMATQH